MLTARTVAALSWWSSAARRRDRRSRTGCLTASSRRCSAPASATSEPRLGWPSWARRLRRRGTRDLAWWELAWGSAFLRIPRGLGTGFAAGILVWQLVDLAFDQVHGLGFILADIPVGLVGGT
jgi:hypothetical protein